MEILSREVKQTIKPQHAIKGAGVLLQQSFILLLSDVN
jgi:hypothetical protein